MEHRRFPRGVAMNQGAEQLFIAVLIDLDCGSSLHLGLEPSALSEITGPVRNYSSRVTFEKNEDQSKYAQANLDVTVENRYIEDL
jgi:hypothetical protein